MGPPFSIIAEGEEWIVVDKPPFLQAHPSKPGGASTLWDHLKELLAYETVCGGQVSLINRLDRETSGLTLVAKTREAARRLSMAMQQRAIRKSYLAIVWGWPKTPAWSVEAPILRRGAVEQSRIYLKQIVHAEGTNCRTSFETLRRFRAETSNGQKFSLLRATPHTGRMHQIRVHLQHSGFPIVGDKLYGPDEECYLRFIDTGWTEELERLLLLSRQALHAEALEVDGLGAWRAPLPPDLSSFLRPEESAPPVPD